MVLQEVDYSRSVPYYQKRRGQQATVRGWRGAILTNHTMASACCCVALAVLESCTGLPGEASKGIHVGMSLDTLESVAGKPDVIAERAGDMARYYVPERPPADEYRWPGDPISNYYYVDRCLNVVIRGGRVTTLKRIEPETMRVLILPLLLGHQERKPR